MLRLFVAVDLPDQERRRLSALRESLAGARWVAAEQLHLTLRFLGWVPESAVETTAAALATVSAPGFTLALAGVGVFPAPPSRKPARVLWAGLAPPEPPIALKAAIDAALGPDPEGRPLSPHVTLARWKERPRPDLAAFLERHQALAGPAFPVTAFHLYQSRMSSTGATYTIVRSFPLRP
jgi:2'-5' RNA ligase